MIKFTLNKQEASNKAKKQKGKQVVFWEYKDLSPATMPKMLPSLYTPGVTWKKPSIHFVCPWGQVSSQGVVT
jgi:hypothetical protein